MIAVTARYVVRTVQWQPVLLGLVAGAGFIVAARLASGTWVTSSLVLALTVMAAAVALALDDPAAETLASVPAPLWRRALRAGAVTVGLAALCWGGLVLLVRGVAATGELTVMAASLWTVALALGAAARRRLGPTAGGLVAAPAVAAFTFATTVVDDPWSFSPGHAGMAWRWAAVAGIAAALLAWSLRDPVRNSR